MANKTMKDLFSKQDYSITQYQGDRWNNIFYKRVSEDPIADLQTDLPIWRNTSKFLFQTVSEIQAAISNAASLIIGKGLTVTPKVSLKDRKKTIAAKIALADYFNNWANSCHIDGQQDLNSVMRAIVSAILRDGDVLVYLTVKDNELKIDLIDTQRLQNPPAEKIPKGSDCFMGVQMTKRYIDGYWVKNTVNDDYTFFPTFDENGNIKSVLLKNPINSYLINSYRGVPIISSLINTVDQLNKLKDAELRSSIIKTRQVAIYEADNLNKARAAVGAGPRKKTGTDTSDTIDNATVASTIGNIPVSQVNDTNILIIPKGDKLDIQSSNDISNPQITQLITQYYKIIASVFNVSSEVLFNILGDSNYSSNIAMRQAAYDNTAIWREYLSRNLLVPIYQLLMRQAVTNGYIPEVKKWDKSVSGVEFIGAGQNTIKPKEVYDIYESSINLGLKSHVQAANESGIDAYQILQEELDYQEVQKNMRIERGLEVLDKIAIEKNAQILTIITNVSTGAITKASAAMMLQLMYYIPADTANLIIDGIEKAVKVDSVPTSAPVEPKA